MNRFRRITLATMLGGIGPPFRKVVVVGLTDNVSDARVTLNPRSVARETPAFADLIIGQLSARGIIESQSPPARSGGRTELDVP